MQFQTAAHRVHALADAEQAELRRQRGRLLGCHRQQIESHPLVFDKDRQTILPRLHQDKRLFRDRVFHCIDQQFSNRLEEEHRLILG
jgi:hypothetical protein